MNAIVMEELLKVARDMEHEARWMDASTHPDPSFVIARAVFRMEALALRVRRAVRQEGEVPLSLSHVVQSMWREGQ